MGQAVAVRPVTEAKAAFGYDWSQNKRRKS
jgi:hypothetical protein